MLIRHTRRPETRSATPLYNDSMSACLKPSLAASGGHQTAGRGRSMSMSPSSSQTASCIMPRQVPSASHSSGRAASLHGAADMTYYHLQYLNVCSTVPHSDAAQKASLLPCQQHRPPARTYMGHTQLVPTEHFVTLTSVLRPASSTSTSMCVRTMLLRATGQEMRGRAPATRILLRLCRKANVPGRLHGSAILADVKA